MSQQVRIALVTGATRGLGRALALDLARRGLRVYGTGRDAEALDALATEAAADELDVRPIRADHREDADNEAVAGRLQAEGRLDVLVHNAGILGPKVEIAEYPVDAWDAVLDVNLRVPFVLTRRLIPLLRAGASVQLLSSGVGVQGRAGWGAYSVSKFGVESLAQTLAQELRPRGVRVNAIDPGGMRTAMRAAAYPAEDPATLPTPEDNTGVFLWLALEAGMETTGQRFSARRWNAEGPPAPPPATEPR